MTITMGSRGGEITRVRTSASFLLHRRNFNCTIKLRIRTGEVVSLFRFVSKTVISKCDFDGRAYGNSSVILACILYLLLRVRLVLFFLNFESFLSKGKGIRILNFSNCLTGVSLYRVAQCFESHVCT